MHRLRRVGVRSGSSMAIESPRPDHWERVSCTRAADGFHAAPKRFKVVPRPAFATAEYLAMAVKIFNEKGGKSDVRNRSDPEADLDLPVSLLRKTRTIFRGATPSSGSDLGPTRYVKRGDCNREFARWPAVKSRAPTLLPEFGHGARQDRPMMPASLVTPESSADQ